MIYETNKPTNLCFVYGTLQSREHNNGSMRAAGGTLIGSAETVEKYPLIVKGLPYLFDNEGMGHNVQGEVFDVSDYGPLDVLEGHPHFYYRKPIKVKLHNTTRVVTANAYFINQPLSDFEGREMHRSYTVRPKHYLSW